MYYLTATMDNLENSESMDEKEILKQLNNLEQKLKKLKEFSRQSDEMRSTRRTMIENLQTSSENNISTESKTGVKRVQFSVDQEDESKEREHRKATLQVRAQNSASLYNLLTGLKTWHNEAKSKKSEIETLKTKRMTLTGQEEIVGYEERIRKLEHENDELGGEVLHFLIQNLTEGKEEYQDFILQLEDENKAMEDTISTLSAKVKFLMENNRALMLENDYLRQTKSGLMNTLSQEDMERTYRRSFFAHTSVASAMLPEANMFFTSQAPKSPSVQLILDLELEDKLSLDILSEGSFALDEQIATWKLDKDSLQDHLKRLEREHKEIEVIHMKMNMVKRYVRKHGVKKINEDTFIDPYHKKI